MSPGSLGAVLFLAMALPAVAANVGGNQPVVALDLQRYSGQWHEIAHLPMFFQRMCVGDITATYTPRADGNITVRNACRNKAGDMDVSEGVARPVDGQPGALEVRFAPDWLAWLPMVWGDYWVVDLDPGYQWAVVGSPSRKYLWILSRTPTMTPELFARLEARAAARGYDLASLVVAAPVE